MRKLISLVVVFSSPSSGAAATAEPSVSPEKLVMEVSTQVLVKIRKTRLWLRLSVSR